MIIKNSFLVLNVFENYFANCKHLKKGSREKLQQNPLALYSSISQYDSFSMLFLSLLWCQVNCLKLIARKFSFCKFHLPTIFHLSSCLASLLCFFLYTYSDLWNKSFAFLLQKIKWIFFLCFYTGFEFIVCASFRGGACFMVFASKTVPQPSGKNRSGRMMMAATTTSKHKET